MRPSPQSNPAQSSTRTGTTKYFHHENLGQHQEKIEQEEQEDVEENITNTHQISAQEVTYNADSGTALIKLEKLQVKHLR